MAGQDIMLADRFLHGSQDDVLTRPGVLARVKASVQRSRRFVLTENAARRFGEVVRDIPVLLIREQEFARPPFDLCWFELPYPVFYSTVSGRPPMSHGDALVGYAIDHETVYVVSGGTVENPRAAPRLMPISYQLHQPWDEEDQLKFCRAVGTSRMQLDAFTWGETFLRLDGGQRRALRAENTPTLLIKEDLHATRVMDALVQGSSGDLRNIVALLLLMNRPSLTEYVREIDPRQGFHRGKPRRFMSYTVVDIPFDPIPVLRKIGTPEGDGVARRRHEVRAHYCHDLPARKGTARGCIHDWQADLQKPDDEHWYCSLCDGRRWRRARHERGDASLGWSSKHYRVTAQTGESAAK